MSIILDDFGNPVEAGNAGDIIKLRAENASLKEQLAAAQKDAENNFAVLRFIYTTFPEVKALIDKAADRIERGEV